MFHSKYLWQKKVRIRLLGFVISVCVFTLFFYFHSLTQKTKLEMNRSAVRLDVMSFNIRYGSAGDGDNSWDNRKEILFGLLKDERPDIIGMQEVLDFQLEEIKAELSGYEHVGIGRDGGVDGEYSPIVYRVDKYRMLESGTFWLSDTPEVVGSITWGNACTRICTWGKFQDKRTMQEFYFYNLHLDHVSQVSREKSIDLILGKIEGLEPIVVTGDFNAGEDNAAILKLKSAGLVDSYRQINKQETEVKTFHGFTGKRQGDKIDYIFVCEGIETTGSEIIYYNIDGKYPSDHFPVSAKIVLRYKKN